MPLTENQKAAQKRYRERKKYINIGLTFKGDIAEGARVKQYLATTGQTANAYIKALIKADLEAKGVPMPTPEEIAQIIGDNN